MAVAAVVVVAGCSPGATPYRLAISASPVPRSPSIRPASRAEVAATARAFEKATAAYNRAIKAALKRRGGDTSLEALTTYYGELAEAERAYEKALDAITFPAEFAEKATALSTAVALVRERELRASRARDKGDLGQILVQVKSADRRASDAAAALREALALPPAK